MLKSGDRVVFAEDHDKAQVNDCGHVVKTEKGLFGRWYIWVRTERDGVIKDVPSTKLLRQEC